MRSTRTSLAAAALAFAAMGGMAATPASVAPKATVSAPAQRQAGQRRRQQYKAVMVAQRITAPGWSVAHDRRTAKKRRNVLKHRRACRG
jgi:hypothetical protein